MYKPPLRGLHKPLVITRPGDLSPALLAPPAKAFPLSYLSSFVLAFVSGVFSLNHKTTSAQRLAGSEIEAKVTFRWEEKKGEAQIYIVNAK